MKDEDAIVTSLAVGILVAAALYVFRPPAPIYYPLDHAWAWQPRPGSPGMAWYARSAWAIGGGVASAALARLGAGRLPAPAWLPRALSLVALVGLVAVLGHLALHEVSDWMK